MKEYLIVFLWGFVPSSLLLGYHIIYRDMWKERWNGKIRGHDHDTDLEAFLWNFVVWDERSSSHDSCSCSSSNSKDDSTPTVIWWRVLAIPFIVGFAVSWLWWMIYESVQLV